MVKRVIVVPEGLAKDTGGAFHPSDYYMAALDLAMDVAGPGGEIFLAPANDFGAHQPEDHFGADYLTARECVCRLECIGSKIEREGYLDTLDNAKYLKHHLIATDRWPLGEVILVCNRPHKLRSELMFRKFGFEVVETVVSSPRQRTGNRMVRRLWFYDVPVVQYFYEGMATVYNLARFYFEKA